MEKNNLYLYGASGHCKVIIDILKCLNQDVESIFDDHPKTADVLGIPVYKNNLNTTLNGKHVIVSIGNNSIRKAIVLKINKALFYSALHPRAMISDYSIIGEGTAVMAGSIINSDALIGKHCIINSGAIVEHECHLEDFVHLSPNCALAGNVDVGEGTHIGIGACVVPGIKIGKWCTIGAGAVITKNIPDFAVVVGNPGKIIKFNNII